MEVMHAAGATEVIQEARYAHLVGAARMGSDPASSVVDKFGRTHDIANLFVCDGSILPTQGSANPGPHHPGSRSPHRGLPYLAGRCSLYERQARHGRATAARPTRAARNLRQRNASPYVILLPGCWQGTIGPKDFFPIEDGRTCGRNRYPISATFLFDRGNSANALVEPGLGTIATISPHKRFHASIPTSVGRRVHNRQCAHRNRINFGWVS